MWFRYRYRAFLNKARAHASDYYYYIKVEDRLEEALAAILNSTLIQFFLELLGRQYRGMLHTKVYELKQLLVPDLSLWSPRQREVVSSLFREFNDAVVHSTEVQERLEDFKSKTKTERGLFEEKVLKELTSVFSNLQRNTKRKLHGVSVISQITLKPICINSFIKTTTSCHDSTVKAKSKSVISRIGP